MEFLEGRQPRVIVAEVGNQADCDLVVFQVVEEGATEGAIFRERPAGSMNDLTLLVLGGIDFPKFFNTDAVMLGFFARIKVEFSIKRLPR